MKLLPGKVLMLSFSPLNIQVFWNCCSFPAVGSKSSNNFTAWTGNNTTKAYVRRFFRWRF